MRSNVDRSDQFIRTERRLLLVRLHAHSSPSSVGNRSPPGMHSHRGATHCIQQERVPTGSHTCHITGALGATPQNGPPLPPSSLPAGGATTSRPTNGTKLQEQEPINASGGLGMVHTPSAAAPVVDVEELGRVDWRRGARSRGSPACSGRAAAVVPQGVWESTAAVTHTQPSSRSSGCGCRPLRSCTMIHDAAGGERDASTKG